VDNKTKLENILTLTKSLCMLYINGEIESVNKDARKLMENGLKESLKLQEEIFIYMMNNNMYNISNVKESVVSTTYNKILKEEC